MTRGIKSDDLRHEVIRPTLKLLGEWSKGAENLLMGTCAQESDMGHLLVQTNGNAEGIFQMEPNTHDGIWANYLPKQPSLALGIYRLTNTLEHGIMIYNLKYACAMSYVYYHWRLEIKKQAWPAHDDVTELAKVWKVHYNTIKGAGTVEDFIDSYERWVK